MAWTEWDTQAALVGLVTNMWVTPDKTMTAQ